MPAILNIVPIFLPIICGILLFWLKFKNKSQRNIYIIIVVIINSIMALLCLYYGSRTGVTLLHFTKILNITVKIDELSCVFAGLVSVLWPLASLYAFEYMEKEERQDNFFAFYTITFGVVLGISFSGNLLTMYIFYELLTLVTFPLVMHPMTEKAVKASRTYLCYSLGGAAFAFVGVIFVMTYGETLDFTYGGVMGTLSSDNTGLMLFVFVITFCGFSVKAAMFPFNRWLIKAAVAPTPVTALLHAVAVVKAGAFALMRLTYYIYGADFVSGTWAQTTVISLALITILFGSFMAVKEQHIKRRLAYSTISNLSYIIFGIALMSPIGLVGALTHMVFHAVMKICSFFCAGAIIHKTGKNYIYELDGIGRKMKVTLACFTISAISLIGIPPLIGFMSKWKLAEAAIDSKSTLGYIGIGVLLISAFLTAIYMLTISIRAYFPSDHIVCEDYENAKDPTWRMKLPLILFASAIIILGIAWKPIVDYLAEVAGL